MTRVYWTEVFPLCDDAVFEACRQRLPRHRLQKLKKLKNREDQNLSVASWVVLQKALEGFPFYSGDENITIQKNGKISFADSPHVHFNISHSGDVAMCAVSGCPVGVDVQVERDFNEDICYRYFLPREADYVLDETDPCKKKDNFFRIWTLKEAYAKMTGGGLGEFRKFEIDMSRDICAVSDDSACDGFFEMFDIPGYKAAVCISQTDDIEFKKINIANCL